MKFKKIISLLCTAAILLSAVSLPVLANETGEADVTKKMLINDRFGNGDFSGWVQVQDSTKKNHCAINTEDIGNGNYALTYQSFKSAPTSVESDWQFEFIKREGFGAGLVFTEGVNTVIKTRIMQAGNTGRYFFKMNLNSVSTDPLATSEWNFDWGTLLRNNKGAVSVPNGWGGNGYMSGSDTTYNTAVYDKWIVVEIKINGITKKASYVITDDTGTIIDRFNNVSIDFPDAANWEETKLQTLAFRLRDPVKLYIDYIQVWQENVKVTAAEADMNLSEVKVKFTGNTAKLLDLSDYVDLYEVDGVTPVETEKSYNSLTNTVSLNSSYTAGNTYKVKVNAEKMLEEIGYTYTAESEISVDAPACTAQNLIVEGKIVPGQALTAKYILMPQGAVEGASVITWIAVDKNGNETEIQTGTSKDYIVEEEYAQSKIKYTVLPKAVVDGVDKEGILTECETPAYPLSKPVASNLKFNRIGAMMGMTLSAVYDYTDADADTETGSIIKWYKGSSELSDDYVEFAEGKVINVTEDLEGMYLKFSVTPKNNALYMGTGDTVLSDAIGPVADAAVASNLFVNPGLEDSVIEPWSTGDVTSVNFAGIEVSTEYAYNGTYSMRTHDRYDNVQDKFYQKVEDVVANKTYLLSTMVKSANGQDHKNFEGYMWSGTNNRPYREQEKITVTDEWQRCTLTITPTVSGAAIFGFVSFEFYENPDMSKVYPFELYLDDLYFGELMITDIDTLELEPVTIPQNGEEAVSPVNSSSRIYNQFGNTSGLHNQKPSILDPGVQGVTIDGLKVIIGSDAVAGTYNIPVACVPNEDIPGVETFIEYVPLTLVAHGDKTPTALNVSLTGSVELGNTLVGSYKFYQVDGKTNASTVRWLYSDTKNGTYLPIEGATSETFVVTSEYADKYIKFEVTPKTSDGDTGPVVTTDFVTYPQAPVASNVTISGDFKVGGEITADYIYYDANGDEEDTALYQWYISSDNGFIPISGATSKSIVLTENTTDKSLYVSVTPVSKTEPFAGSAADSEAYFGPTVPTVKDVYIENKNGVLTGKYTYEHKHNASEKGTEFKWTVGGNEVSNTSTCNINFNGTQLVTFTVTPMGDTNPSKGTPVTVSMYVTGLNDGGAPSGGVVGGGFAGGGSGGGSGGSVSAGASSGGVPNINEMKVPEPEKNESENDEPESDIQGHWGEAYIKNMEERGVMKADENGKYDPDKIVVRSEMITYLFDALKLQETEYSSEFSDVSALDDYSGKLQTMIDNGTIASYHEFRPNDGISREEMCKILYISLENAGKLKKSEENFLDCFADKDLISDWAINYVNTIFANKIMIGTSDTTFAPNENITRAQVATMLVRILDVMEKEAE